MSQLSFRFRVLEGARALHRLARHLEDRGGSFVWFDSALKTHRDRGMSVLCEAGEQGFCADRTCRRETEGEPSVSRMRRSFEAQGARRRGAFERALPEGLPSGGFFGGWVGYIAYEAQIDFDPAFSGRDAELPYPRIQFGVADRGVTVFHDRQLTCLWEWMPSGASSGHLEEWAALLGDDEGVSQPTGRRLALAGWRLVDDPVPREWYERGVRDILERIIRGEVYQVNLTTPVGATTGPDPLNLYFSLRSESPASYAAYLRWPGVTLLSSSPELFFDLTDGWITTRPMKGTRPRGEDPIEDRKLAAALADSEKDRAENLMIVDLMRNDMSRVCDLGSVEVTDLFRVECYSTVYQMTSGVRGRLRPEEDVFGALGALFPPGSMTGAPKIQATRIIQSLETPPRGIYSGCLGFVDWSGDACFSVVIRTLVCHERGAVWSVGGGIVAESSPNREYTEACDKLRALSRALAPSWRSAEAPESPLGSDPRSE